MTVAEGVANLACVGVTARAVVNCLNFGNPEHPSVMWQLVEAMNRDFATPLVTTETGGRRGGGARVTELGQEALRQFRRMELRASAIDKGDALKATLRKVTD